MDNIESHGGLKNGSYFYICNRQTQLALTYTSDDLQPKICFKPLNQTSSDQIWMIEQVRSNQYQIVHAYSTLVLAANRKTAKMQYGNWTSQQLFFVQKSDPIYNPLQHWIKVGKLSDFYLFYDSNLHCGETNPKASKCRWQLKPITNKNQILKSSLIQFAYSGLYLDLPGASLKPDVQIIQYKLNSRCNQRWKFQRIRQSNDYMIISVRSKMCLTVKGGKQKAKTVIVQQSPQNGSLAQQWTLTHQGLSLFIIKSKVVKEGLFLGIEHNSMNECAKVVLTDQQQYAFWRLIGFHENQE